MFNVATFFQNKINVNQMVTKFLKKSFDREQASLTMKTSKQKKKTTNKPKNKKQKTKQNKTKHFKKIKPKPKNIKQYNTKNCKKKKKTNIFQGISFSNIIEVMLVNELEKYQDKSTIQFRNKSQLYIK